MKKFKKTRIIVIAIGVVVSVFSFSLLNQNDSQLIIGEWRSEGCSTCTLKFDNNGKCYDYDEGELIDTYVYSIETTSPQCDMEVDEGPLFKYLKMINVANNNEQYCYEILSLNDTHLQLRMIDSGGSNTYQRIDLN